MKPKIDVSRVSSDSTSGSPLRYDSGVKYDDSDAYYDRWYPASSLSQGEIPKTKAVVEDVETDIENVVPKIKVEEN